MKKQISLLATIFWMALCAPCIAQTTWTGTMSSDWNVIQNWTNGIPAANTNVIIPAVSGSNSPEVSTSAYCKNLEVQVGASLILNTNAQLEIHGDVTNNGNFQTDGSMIVFAGITHIGDNITLDNIKINGALYSTSSNLLVRGNWENNGAFFHNNGTVQFDDNTIISGTTATTFNNVYINGTLEGHIQVINVQGNWLNNGTFIHNNGTVRFCGTSNQSIGLVSENNFWDVVVDNPSFGVCLVSDQKINGSLQLTNGYVDLYSHTLKITNSNTAAITRTNGFIISESIPMSGYSFLQWNIGTKTGTYVFPFATVDGYEYIPVTVEVSARGEGNGFLSIATYSTDDQNEPYPDGVTNMNDSTGQVQWGKVVNRYWVTSVSNYTTAPVSAITFNAAHNEIGYNRNFITEKWNGVDWVSASASQVAMASGVRANNISDYSIFVMADGTVDNSGQQANGIAGINGAQNKFSIYPNIIGTNSQNIRIQNHNSVSGTFIISDASGKQVFSGKADNSEINLEGSTLNAGMYLVSLVDGGSMQTQKLLVINN